MWTPPPGSRAQRKGASTPAPREAGASIGAPRAGGSRGKVRDRVIFIDRARQRWTAGVDRPSLPTDAMAHLSRSRAATLGRTGDTSDAGGEVEHRILASAEQSLLASLAKQRISNATAPPKIFAKTVLRSPDDPTFQGAHFGEGAAEVRALSERDNCANPWDGVHRVLPGVAHLRARTGVRHERVLAAWRGERERLADVARARVATAVGMLRDAIATSDASLAEGTRVYDDDAALVELTTDEARRVWDETVATHLRNRTTWIDNLEKDVASAATETREEMATALAHTVDALSAVAHASRGDVERFAAEATMEINADALEDRRGVAELLARLRTREIERERSERTAYDAALIRWRTLRTERGVSLFAELIQSERMSDNPEREAITRELAEDQVKARDSLLAHANAFKALLPGRGTTAAAAAALLIRFVPLWCGDEPGRGEAMGRGSSRQVRRVGRGVCARFQTPGSARA